MFNGFSIDPPSQISSGVVGIIAVGSSSIVIHILVDITLAHPPTEKLTSHLYSYIPAVPVDTGSVGFIPDGLPFIYH
jgi:hypothetical protein